MQGVVKRAEQVSKLFSEVDQQYLMAAAYLHDIGYSPVIKNTGFHPLDGAKYILNNLGDMRLAALVAHHSESRFEATLRGLSEELDSYPCEHSAVTDALIYCDMTTNGIGRHVILKERLADILHRYNETDIVIRALRQARPYWALAVARTQRRLHRYELEVGLQIN
ncbi:MAG TPA: HD domain-containing protein [Ktedonobacteraceae bacterium]|nr:HD domain-containing protein [Ktedonobacteraceae bacterium]